MPSKLTKKEKKKVKRIKKKLTTMFCTKVNVFGHCICPHCGFVILTFLDNENLKVADDKCEKCGKKIIFSEDILKDVRYRQKRIKQLLEKVTSLEYDKIDVIEAGIDRECNIEEIALLCKYFRCGIGQLSAQVKKLLYKKGLQTNGES